MEKEISSILFIHSGLDIDWTDYFKQFPFPGYQALLPVCSEKAVNRN